MKQTGPKARALQVLCCTLGLVGCQTFLGEKGGAPLPTDQQLEPESQAMAAGPGSFRAEPEPAGDVNPEALAATPEPSTGSAADADLREDPHTVQANAKRPESTSSNILRPTNLSDPGPGASAKHNSRRWQLANELRGLNGWNLYESEDYFIATPIDDPLLMEGAKRRLDAIRDRLLRDLPPGLAGSDGPRPLLRFLPNRAAFEASGARRGTTAQWIPAENTLVCFDAGSEGLRETQTWPALQHVLVHEYLTATLRIQNVPSWLLYGLAARYEALRFRTTPEGGRWEEPDAATLNQALSEAVAADAPMPLARLFQFSPQEFHGVNEFGSGAYRNLILARSFVSFCWDAGSEPEFSAPAGFLETFTATLANGIEPGAALEKARGAQSLVSIDAAWRHWIEAATGRALPEAP